MKKKEELSKVVKDKKDAVKGAVKDKATENLDKAKSKLEEVKAKAKSRVSGNGTPIDEEKSDSVAKNAYRKL